jgi:hypothetical protein
MEINFVRHMRPTERVNLFIILIARQGGKRMIFFSLAGWQNIKNEGKLYKKIEGKMKTIKILILSIMVIGLFQGNLFSIIYSRVEGIVIDESNEPLNGARVMLFSCVDMAQHTSCYKVNDNITNNKGYFRFDDIEFGIYAIFVLNDGYAATGPYSNILEVADKGPTSHTIEIPPQYKFNVKEGQIKYFKIKLEKEAKLIVNVTAKYPGGLMPKIQLINQLTIKHPSYKNEIDDMIETFENTYYSKYQSKYLKEGLIDVSIISSGYIDKNYQIQLKKNEVQTINHVLDFTTGQVLYGQITDKSSGKPLIAYVGLSGDNDVEVQALLDENGNYWIGGIEPGVYLLFISYSNEKYLKTTVTINPGEKKIFNIAL